MEAEEADGGRDDINFEGDRDTVVALLSLDNPGGVDAISTRYDVVIKGGGVQRQRRQREGGTTLTLRVIVTNWGRARRRRR